MIYIVSKNWLDRYRRNRMLVALGIFLFALVPFLCIKVVYSHLPENWSLVPYLFGFALLLAWSYQYFLGRREESFRIEGDNLIIERITRIRRTRSTIPMICLHDVHENDAGGYGRGLILEFVDYPSVLIYSASLEIPDTYQSLLREIQAYPTAPRPKLQFPYVTLLLSSTLVLIYAMQSFQPDTALIDFAGEGGFVPELVWSGEFYRFVSSGFLHASLLHLSLNTAALILLGFALEHYTGPVKFISLFLVGVALASLAMYLTDVPIGVGASGGVFTLAGAYVYLKLSRPDDFVDRFPTASVTAVFVGALCDFLIRSFLGETIVVVHIAGLGFGVLLIWIIGRWPRVLPVSAALLLTGAAWSYQQFGLWNENRALNLARQWLYHPTKIPEFVQHVAWTIAISPLTDQQAAEDALSRLSGLSDPEALKVRATLLARLGRLDEAISLQNRQLSGAADPVIHASHLVRFQLARNGRTAATVKKGTGAHAGYTDALCVRGSDMLFFRYPTAGTPNTKACTSELQMLDYGDGNYRPHDGLVLDAGVLDLPLLLHHADEVSR